MGDLREDLIRLTGFREGVEAASRLVYDAPEFSRIGRRQMDVIYERIRALSPQGDDSKRR